VPWDEKRLTQLRRYLRELLDISPAFMRNLEPEDHVEQDLDQLEATAHQLSKTLKAAGFARADREGWNGPVMQKAAVRPPRLQLRVISRPPQSDSDG